MFPKVAQLKDVEALRARLAALGLDVPVDDRILTAAEGSPLAEPCNVGGFKVGNRWCIHPMEGWDGQRDGAPSDRTRRRWRRFGESGAKLIWGGEAAAVQHDGRANPNQLVASPANTKALAELREGLVNEHRSRYGSTDDLLIGLQLTHSGRFSRPDDHRPKPKIACRNPLLDRKFGLDPNDDSLVCTDDYLERVADSFVAAAGMAEAAGFAFVDIKACHSYLLNELLGARRRPGPFGGDFEGRTRLLRSIIARIRDRYPSLLVGVRLSMFDTVPYEQGDEHGRPMPHDDQIPYEFGFGVDPLDPTRIDLTETIELLRVLRDEGVSLVNLTAGSPYYCPHLLRPAAFPPSDGYLPPEDPLVGVARHIQAARQCKAAVPDLPMVGSGYSYLQDYVPHAAQAVVRNGWIDFVGVGRMVLSYPSLPADALSTGKLARKLICRTFSDCTTAPRNGLASGCYPLDPFYKAAPEAEAVKAAKQKARARLEAAD